MQGIMRTNMKKLTFILPHLSRYLGLYLPLLNTTCGPWLLIGGSIYLLTGSEGPIYSLELVFLHRGGHQYKQANWRALVEYIWDNHLCDQS